MSCSMDLSEWVLSSPRSLWWLSSVAWWSQSGRTWTAPAWWCPNVLNGQGRNPVGEAGSNSCQNKWLKIYIYLRIMQYYFMYEIYIFILNRTVTGGLFMFKIKLRNICSLLFLCPDTTISKHCMLWLRLGLGIMQFWRTAPQYTSESLIDNSHFFEIVHAPVAAG